MEVMTDHLPWPSRDHRSLAEVEETRDLEGRRRAGLYMRTEALARLVVLKIKEKLHNPPPERGGPRSAA